MMRKIDPAEFIEVIERKKQMLDKLRKELCISASGGIKKVK